MCTIDRLNSQTMSSWSPDLHNGKMKSRRKHLICWKCKAVARLLGVQSDHGYRRSGCQHGRSTRDSGGRHPVLSHIDETLDRKQEGNHIAFGSAASSRSIWLQTQFNVYAEAVLTLFRTHTGGSCIRDTVSKARLKYCFKLEKAQIASTKVSKNVTANHFLLTVQLPSAACQTVSMSKCLVV